jgi:low affinity Fe/Cu permease
MREAFRKFAAATARVVGSPWIFVLAVLLIVGWGLSGPLFGFSDTWQLVINTTTTIVTFLMVFLIQNTQNRDSEAIHLKLDELIRAVQTARTRLVDLEDLSDDQLATLREEFQRLREIHSADGDQVVVEAGAKPPDRRVSDSPEGSGTPGRRAGDRRPAVER